MTKLSELIEQRRNLLGLSYRELGERASMTGANAHRMATNTRLQVPTLDVLQRLAVALEMDVRDLQEAVAFDAELVPSSRADDIRARASIDVEGLTRDDVAILISLRDRLRQAANA